MIQILAYARYATLWHSQKLASMVLYMLKSGGMGNKVLISYLPVIELHTTIPADTLSVQLTLLNGTSDYDIMEPQLIVWK